MSISTDELERAFLIDFLRGYGLLITSTAYAVTMLFILVMGFLGITSAIALYTSSFPYKRQSFLLGLTGAAGGGGVAFLFFHGLSGSTAEMLLLLCLSELVVFFLFQTSRSLN